MGLLVAMLVVVGCTPDEGSDTDSGGAETDSDPAPVEEPDDEEQVDGAEEDEEEAEEPTDLDVQLTEISEQVSVLRDLPMLEEIETQTVPSDELAEIVTERDPDAEALQDIAASQRVLAALRHVPEDIELEAVLDDLLAANVVGLYDPEDSVAYVLDELDDEPLSPSSATTAAHELLHALQDQHFDLTRVEEIPDIDGDATLAFMSVVEGDAVLLEDEWSATHQSDEERAQAEQDRFADAQAQVDALDDVPSYLVESLVFPYVAGEQFVAALIEDGGYEAVDEALEDPPTSTLEILDPTRYLEGDFEAGDIDPGNDPVGEWDELLRSSFGAFDVLALFGAAGEGEAARGASAWPAWEAGELVAWERGDELIVAAGWAFSDEERAQTVCDALPAWYADVADGEPDGDVLISDRDVLAVACEQERVRFALAPEAQTATAVAELQETER